MKRACPAATTTVEPRYGRGNAYCNVPSSFLTRAARPLTHPKSDFRKLCARTLTSDSFRWLGTSQKTFVNRNGVDNVLSIS